MGNDMTLVLFDIDGTLIQTGGAGSTAMRRAGARLFGIPDLFKGRSFAGIVDDGIVGGAMAAAGIPPTPRRLGRFKQTYLRYLKRHIHEHPGRAMPGVHEAVKACAGRALVGLQTGNWRVGAETKLEHFGLWMPFDHGIGGFGCDASERPGLMPAALRRAQRYGWQGGRVVVIGDTPADVTCARVGVSAWTGPAVDLVTVAVDTGRPTRAELEASTPDLLLDDLAVGLKDLLALL